MKQHLPVHLLRPQAVQGWLLPTCRKPTTDFRGMKKPHRGIVRVRSGKEVKPDKPGDLYFKLP